MVGSLLLRGMLAGLIAGLIAFGFARIYGEPQVDRAIAFEESRGAAEHDHDDAAQGTAAAHDHGEEEELVSRGTQAGLGLFTGIVVYGAALGGIFALVFSYAHGRLGRLGPRATAALLAGAGFVALVLAPALKYPANPPAVGNPDTIGLRTELYFGMLLIALVAMILAFNVAKLLWERRGAWTAALAGAAVFLVVVAAAALALPAIDEVPDAFSADLLWHFRMASLGIHAILWTVIGLGFGYLAERQLSGQAPQRTVTHAALR